MRSAKKVYPEKREVMGYPALPAAPIDLTRRQRKDEWGNPPS